MNVMSSRPSLSVSEGEKTAVIRPVLKGEKTAFLFLFLKFDQMTSGFLYSPDKTLRGFESVSPELIKYPRFQGKNV